MRIKIRIFSSSCGERGYLSLIGLLISIAIACFLFYFLLNTYFKSIATDGTIYNSTVNSSANTAGYQSIVKTTRSAIDNINKQHQAQIDELIKKQ
jgi:hypothetical protein